MSEDYEARLDKLICPSCRKPQSFDEFFEKKRNCSQCKLKFEKLNVTSGIQPRKIHHTSPCYCASLILSRYLGFAFLTEILRKFIAYSSDSHCIIIYDLLLLLLLFCIHHWISSSMFQIWVHDTCNSNSSYIYTKFHL